VKKINSLQFTSMFLMLTITSYTGIGILSIIKTDARNAWMSVILSGILGLVILSLFIYINSFKENLTINEKNKILFGKILGTIINYLIIIITFLYGISIFYNLNNFIVSQFLTRTPQYIIGILFSLLIIYINIKGIETISRTSLLLFSINIILFLIQFLSLTPQIDFSNFKPILENGINGVISGSFRICLLNFTPMLILLIIPKDYINDKDKFRKSLIISFIISIIIILLMIIVTIGNLGVELSSLYQYPEYIVLKRITIFNFLDKVENIIVIQWLFGLFTSTSIVVYNITKNLKKKDSKILPILITSIILILSLNIFKNNTVFEYYTLNIAPIIYIILLLIFFIIGFKIYLYKRKNNNS